MQKDMRRAIYLWEEAAELGCIGALFELAYSYDYGTGVQEDKAKAAEFYEKATMRGHAESRCNLGFIEKEKGDDDRAVRHFMISAQMGDEISVENIKAMFMNGIATKEQYAEALKGYQYAVKEWKSRDRDEAKANRRRLGVLSWQ